MSDLRASIFVPSKPESVGLWLATSSRFAAFVCTTTWTLITKSFQPAKPASLRWGVLAGLIDVSGSVLFFRALQAGRMDAAVVLSSLYPVITVLWARIVLKEQFSRWKIAGVLAALTAVPLIAS